MIKVSVIVPVYNASLYLDKGIKSLINQTLKDIEFIFVDDGSTDDSAKIIKKYMKNDKRIMLFEKENGGQSSARNMGLEHAKGEYIGFLDSDDYVEADMYQDMYDNAKGKNADIVVCGYCIEEAGKSSNKQYEFLDKTILSGSEYIMSTPSVCNKLYRKTYLDKVNFKFIEGIIYEDLAEIPTLVLGNPKILYLKKAFYHYVHTDVSTMRALEYKSKFEDIFIAIKHLYEKVIDKGYNKELEYLITYHFLYLASLNFFKYEKYEHIDHIANDMRKYFPKWYKNELVLTNFSRKQILYMKLFYYKKYSIIKLYRRIIDRNDKEQKDN